MTCGVNVTIEIGTHSPPLEVDAKGVVRVGGTRVTLDSVVVAFRSGATAEEIAQQFPTLALADIYAVIAYFLSHEDDVDRYLESRGEHAASVRAANEARFGQTGIRDRLLARRKTRP